MLPPGEWDPNIRIEPPNKLPSQEKLQKQLQQLETELAATQKELTQLQADQRTLHIVQSNFSSMLQDADILPELSSENPEQSI